MRRSNTVLKYEKAQFLGYELFLIFRHLQTESVVSLLPPPPPYSSPKIDFSLGGGIQIKISQSKFLEKSEKITISNNLFFFTKKPILKIPT